MAADARAGGVATASAPRLYPIQLVDAFCVSCRADRRERRDDDVFEKGINARLGYTTLDETATQFSCRLDVELLAPVLEREAAELAVTVQGNFRGADPIPQELLEAFVSFTPVVQLWPYARGFLADLGRMLGVALPPLPMIDALVPSSEEENREDESEGQVESPEGT